MPLSFYEDNLLPGEIFSHEFIDIKFNRQYDPSSLKKMYFFMWDWNIAHYWKGWAFYRIRWLFDRKLMLPAEDMKVTLSFPQTYAIIYRNEHDEITGWDFSEFDPTEYIEGVYNFK